MFALADADTARLLRVLSLAGPTSAPALADQLQLHHELVRDLLDRAVRLGVVRQRDCATTRYEVDSAAVVTAVQRHRDALLGAVA